MKDFQPIKFAPAEVCTDDAIDGLYAAVKAGEDTIEKEYNDAHRIVGGGSDVFRLQCVYTLANGEERRVPDTSEYRALYIGRVWSRDNEEQFKAYNS